jgi:serine phosphatase RsbU (regulator of sigma subunit)
MKIVVIEDDPSILRGLEASLRMESYEVLSAADGEKGYRLVRDERPDLVILDLMLPKLNGYDVCRQIRRNGLATPIMMLTAQAMETDRVQGFDAGADDYVTKPFSVRELLGRVRAILRRSEGRSDLANQRELDAARQIQERLIPTEIPQVAGVHIDARWIPARIAGGDYFDVLKFDDDTIAVCIADVCGKGMPAAMMVSNLQASVRAYVQKHISPRELCAQVNRVMCGNLAGRGFISFFYGVIDPIRKRFTYCNAGHNPPILVSGGASHLLDCGGGILGVMDQWDYCEQQLSLNSGDRILLYTDGVTEASNTMREEFGEDRLVETVRRYDSSDAAALTETVIETVRRFSNGNFEDDLTVVGITVE